MTRTYATYGMTLFSAFAVYWTFGVMSTVAASYTWVPFLGFLASIFHFGISSWLFLYFPKTGKVLGVLTAMAMCIWPSTAFVGTIAELDWFQTLLYFIPVAFSILVIYNHVKTYGESTRPILLLRIILSAIPFGLFILYIVHIITMIQMGQIIIGD